VLTKQGKLGLIVCVPLIIGLISFYAIKKEMEHTSQEYLEESKTEYERKNKIMWSKMIESIPNPFQQDPRKIEISLLDPKNQDDEALYYRSLMGIIETQIDSIDAAYQFSVPIDEGMTRDICSSKYSVLDGLKRNELPLGPKMNEKLIRMTTNRQC